MAQCAMNSKANCESDGSQVMEAQTAMLEMKKELKDQKVVVRSSNESVEQLQSRNSELEPLVDELALLTPKAAAAAALREKLTKVTT